METEVAWGNTTVVLSRLSSRWAWALHRLETRVWWLRRFKLLDVIAPELSVNFSFSSVLWVRAVKGHLLLPASSFCLSSLRSHYVSPPASRLKYGTYGWTVLHNCSQCSYFIGAFLKNMSLCHSLVLCLHFSSSSLSAGLCSSQLWNITTIVYDLSIPHPALTWCCVEG